MTDLQWLQSAGMQLGISSLIFLLFYTYLKMQAKKMNDDASKDAVREVIKMHRERVEALDRNYSEMIKQLVDHQRQMSEQAQGLDREHFKLLEGFLETIQAHTMILARIENKLDSPPFRSRHCE